MYGSGGDTLLAILAIVSLVASLVVANMNYPGRSQAAEGNYKRIQQISLSAEALRDRRSGLSEVEIVQREYEIARDYEIALESSENHSDADYYRTFTPPKEPSTIRRDTFVSVVPFLTLIAPIGVAVPLAIWLFRG